jgi:DNA modification methylase
VRSRLAALPSGSVDCVITSPPYFGLRDYGQEGQFGLEADVDAWVAKLVEVCDGLARVLKPSGSLWLNVGDGYSSHAKQGAAKKSLLLGPQRLAIALSRAGWIVRNQVIWAKTNPIPSSVGDRFSCGYEVVLFLVRSTHYFFDLDAIRQPLVSSQARRANARGYRYLPEHAKPPEGADDNQGLNALKARGIAGHPLGKNPGDVWATSTAGYRGAHFATFPLALVERPLLATCPVRICTACGLPWVREPVDRTREPLVVGELRPDCGCRASTRPGVVLDPFMGSGTVAVAAGRHGRNWIGIELNPKYATLAQQRLTRWREQQRNEAQGEQRR